MDKKKIKYKIKSDLYDESDYIKDCPNGVYVPTTLPPVKRIIAMGDIHGDLNLAIRSFKLSKLIDDNYNWIANPPNTVVVQVGDQIDSCRPIPGVSDCHFVKEAGDKADDMNIIDFFNEMDKKAREKGGAVYSLLGNHELMNSQGNFSYASYENFENFYYTINGETFKGKEGRKAAFKPGGKVASMLACSRPAILVIGSNMFVHAGILPALVNRLDHIPFDSDTKLKYLNAIVRKWLLNKLSGKDVKDKILFVDNTELSPFWTRIYGSIPKDTNLESTHCFSEVKKIIEVFKIGQIVVGHTPQMFTNKSGINGTCYNSDGENKLYRVDGGFSDAFKKFNHHDVAQVLEIIDDNKFNILTDDKLGDFLPGVKVELKPSAGEKVAKIFSQNRNKISKTIGNKIY